MRTPRALTALTALVIVATPLAACSSDNNSSQATTSDRTVTVTMTDNAYTPKNISAKAGESVTFKFVNDGQMTHEAYIGSEKDQEGHASEMMGGDGGHSMDMSGDGVVTVKPGQDATLTKEFTEAGTMVIGCHQPGHWESGMKATVTVSSPQVKTGPDRVDGQTYMVLEDGDPRIGERSLLVALAVCCALPMLAIILLTSVAGLALDPAVAAAVGITAAGLCVGIMVLHRRPGHPDDGGRTQHH